MTPENSAYFYSACVVVAVALTVYVISLAARGRSLRARQRALERSGPDGADRSGVA